MNNSMNILPDEIIQFISRTLHNIYMSDLCKEIQSKIIISEDIIHSCKLINVNYNHIWCELHKKTLWNKIENQKITIKSCKQYITTKPRQFLL